VAKAHGAAKTGDNLGRSWHVSSMCGEGCVDRRGFYDESLEESCQGDVTWAFPMRGTCGGYMYEKHISRGRLFRREGLSRHGGLVIHFEKVSCLVPLRTGMSREPDHRTL